MALKMGVCLSEASFAHLAMTGILKGMGVSGGRLFLGSFFFGGTKKNEYARVSGNRPGILSAQKNSIYADVNGIFTKKNKKTLKNFPVPPVLNENENNESMRLTDDG